MSRKFEVTFITIVPSPYQRDLFRALAARPEIELKVYYMEATSPGYPSPEAPLRPLKRFAGLLDAARPRPLAFQLAIV